MKKTSRLNQEYATNCIDEVIQYFMEREKALSATADV